MSAEEETKIVEAEVIAEEEKVAATVEDKGAEKKKPKKKKKTKNLVGNLEEKVREATETAAKYSETPVHVKVDEVTEDVRQMNFAEAHTEDALKKHKFWANQPVVAPGTAVGGDVNSPLHKDLKPTETKAVPAAKLPEGLFWCTVEVEGKAAMAEVYTLLCENYVEDEDNMFRFNYSPNFLKWALLTPGHFNDWYVGIRATADNKYGLKENELCGFITGIPINLRIKDTVVRMTEINFLCVHKAVRALRLAPLLIAEVKRRVWLRGMFQALYTAGIKIPTPFATCRYYHRTLNMKKLVDVEFTALRRNRTMKMSERLFAVPEEPAMKGFRPMVEADIPAVQDILGKYLSKFPVAPVYTEEEIRHWFLPRKDVIYTYVVEDPHTHAITAMTSFYNLSSSVLNHPKHKMLNAAYLFYNVNTKGKLTPVVADALVMAKKHDFDVVNCLNLMDNADFLEELKFGPGDGDLNYYLFNWACPQIEPKEVGVVLL